jgi:hypothetical protein
MLLGRSRNTTSQPDGASDCRWSRQNQSVRFLKPDYPISTVSNKVFQFCSFHVATLYFFFVHGHRKFIRLVSLLQNDVKKLMEA